MLEWMILPFRRYAQFDGRSRRKEYWSFVVLNVIIYAVLTAMMFAGGLSGYFDSAPIVSAPVFFVGAGIAGLYWLAALFPTVAVTVRRLHDRDLSGWWYLGSVVASLIPVIGLLAGIALFIVMLLPGTPGPNRFGLDPRDPSGSEVFA